MQYRLAGLIVGLTLSASVAGAQADLVTNGSFESGLSGWTQYDGGCSPSTAATIAGGTSGASALQLSNADCYGGLSQAMPTIAGHTYHITADYRIVGGPPSDYDPSSSVFYGQPSAFEMYFAGDIGCGGGSAASGVWFSINCYPVLSGNNEALRLDGFNDFGTLEVDNVSVVDVTTTPEPASFALLGTGLVGLAPLARRKLRSR